MQHGWSRRQGYLGGRMARLVVAAAAATSTVGTFVAACGQGDELPPLDRRIHNPIEAGPDVPDVGVDPNLGVIPDPEAPCDDGLPLEDADPLHAARAAEICQAASETTWGIVGARWTLLDGTAVVDADHPNYHLGHGIFPKFGPLQAQAGERMLAISSGSARQPTDPDYTEPGLGLAKIYTCAYPPGFPKPSPACPGVEPAEAHDVAALELELRAPDEAKGFRFRFDFHTSEWPEYICDQFNDAFVALLSPAPPDHADGNVSFDSKGNPVSVNAAFMRVCTCAGGAPCEAGGKKFLCDLGGDPLLGTGFEGHAATGWLKTQALVEGGSTIKLRWAVYDAGDGILDSTTLIDDFAWLGEVDGGVITEPEDTPK